MISFLVSQHCFGHEVNFMVSGSIKYLCIHNMALLSKNIYGLFTLPSTFLEKITTKVHPENIYRINTFLIFYLQN